MAIKNNIFVDSNFFIALSNLGDNQHKKAVEVKKKITKGNYILTITNLIFLEIVTVLSQRLGRQEAVGIGEKLLTDADMKIVHVNTDLHKLSWEIFKEVSKKNMSFVDCSSIVAMDAEGIEKFLTFDNEDFAPLRKKYRFSFF
ncbi:MAG: PIN domain-containing protein [bacterium]|nr:PIN domain-containing protein [bacterium]